MIARESTSGISPKQSSPDRLDELGIVGAGGGGFPAAAKFRTQVATVIANAVNIEDGQIRRAPASSIDPDSEYGNGVWFPDVRPLIAPYINELLAHLVAYA